MPAGLQTLMFLLSGSVAVICSESVAVMTDVCDLRTFVALPAGNKCSKYLVRGFCHACKLRLFDKITKILRKSNRIQLTMIGVGI